MPSNCRCGAVITTAEAESQGGMCQDCWEDFLSSGGSLVVHMEVKRFVLEDIKENGTPRAVTHQTLLAHLQNRYLDPVLNELLDEGEIYEPLLGHYKPVVGGGR